MSKEINSPEAFLYSKIAFLALLYSAALELYSASASSNAPFLAWFPSIMTYDDGRDYVTLKGEGFALVQSEDKSASPVQKDKTVFIYRMLNGDLQNAESFKDEYMLDYSWAEPTAGLLFFGKNKK